MPVEQEKPWQDESILGRGFVETVLAAARENLQKDGSLAPVLFLQFDSGERTILLLKDLPGTTDEKQVYFTALGVFLQRTGKRLQEAVFVSEAWYVELRGESVDVGVAPSQHPDRKEAITVVGRDAEGTRQTSVIQPFSRDRQNQPVFGKREMEEYNAPVGDGPRAVGLVDYLFDGT